MTEGQCQGQKARCMRQRHLGALHLHLGSSHKAESTGEVFPPSNYLIAQTVVFTAENQKRQRSKAARTKPSLFSPH